jgi:hypothetical protein
MENQVIHILVLLCTIITLIIPLVQLSIGFHYIVKDGQNTNDTCSAAPNLSLLMAIGGIFALFFLGIACGFLKILSSINNQLSDIDRRISKILIGESLIF